MAATPCIEVGCPNMALPSSVRRRSSRCREHQREVDRVRNARPNRQAYQAKAWRDFPVAGPCVDCGSNEDLTKDHQVPLALGGTNDPRNIVIRCRRCNGAKSGKLASEGTVRRSTEPKPKTTWWIL